MITIRAEINILMDIFSFNNGFDNNMAHTGEDAVREVALEIPIIFTLYRNIIPPNAIDNIPEMAIKYKFFLGYALFLVHGRVRKNKNPKRRGNLIAFAVITLIFLIPIVINMDAMDQDIAVIKAANRPKLFSLS